MFCILCINATFWCGCLTLSLIDLVDMILTRILHKDSLKGNFLGTFCNQSVADEQYVGSAAIVRRVLKRQEARGKRQGG